MEQVYLTAGMPSDSVINTCQDCGRIPRSVRFRDAMPGNVKNYTLSHIFNGLSGMNVG